MLRRNLVAGWRKLTARLITDRSTEASAFQIEACVLEDRLLYSATALPIDLDAAAESGGGFEITDAEVSALMALVDADLNADLVTESTSAETVDSNIASEPVALQDDSSVAPSSSESASTSETATTPDRSVAFIDASLDNLDQLIEQLHASFDSSDSTLEVVLIDGQRSGIEQVGLFLSQAEHDYSSVHLVTHGSSGQFQLGSDWVNIHTLADQSQQFLMWQDGLSDDADLLIYGCQVASTADGQELGTALAKLLDVDVALSSDATGSLQRGGDWDLEFQVGVIETSNQIQVSAPEAWDGLLLTYTVTNTNDSGAGSLRQAITDANNNAGADTISFSIGTGSQTISLSTLLPNITGLVTLDGWTQSGYTSSPLIIIDGNGLTGDGLVLTSSADNSTIRGLVIRDFNGDGIQLNSGASGITIQGNYLGAFGAAGTYLGVAEENTGNGLNILGDNNTIGGTTAAARNVIGGNQMNGILITGGAGFSNIVTGNYIGVDASGNSAAGNTLNGILLSASANQTTIGGTLASHRNVIGSNGGAGIQNDGETSDTNTIRNNYIGLGADGTTILGNGGSGILISNGGDNIVIGGVGMGNVIMGNRSSGIDINGISAGTSILGNYIGVNAAGTVVYGNGQAGILLQNSAGNTTIGGTNNGEANVITDNGSMSSTVNAGIQIQSTASTGNKIVANSIYGNIGLGIDLGTTGITLNDTGDADTGPNNLQNFPVFTAASVNSAGTTVTLSGSVNSNASVTGLVLHFYATPSSGDVNARQGKRYLGSTTVNTDASGNATFTNTALTGFSGSVAAGELITATATSPGTNGNTSEFSLGVVAVSSAGNSAPNNSQIASTVDGGLTINTSGYSSYLQAEDASALLGGRTQLSMEFQFRANAIPGFGQYALASYATQTDGDAVYIGGSKGVSGEAIGFSINGAYAEISYDVDAIFDGNVHSFALTWTQTSGAWSMYLDGALIGSGTGIASGQSIASGGQLVFGADLDAGTDTWQRGGLFQGTFYDARIFSDVRSAAEIAASYRDDLPLNDGNLVANWKFNELTSDSRIASTVNGNSLMLRSFVTPGATSDAASLELRLDENSTAGTVVGAVQSIDVERESRITTLLAADINLRYNAETGKFYKLVTSSGTWSTAQSGAMATSLGGIAGQLLTVNSASENAFATTLSGGLSNWLNGSDSVTEGTWRWYTGSTASNLFWQGTGTGYAVGGAYTNFTSGEPNDSGGIEDFLQMSTSGFWSDSSSSATASAYIIEWNADTVLDATNALTYSITSQSVAGAFAINSSTGVITVANGSLLNYEAQTSQTLTIRTTDASGATFDKSYTIVINNLTEENNAPSDLSSGINLNTDGGNNAYLMTASGGSLLGGRTALTIESSFSIQSNNSSLNTLFSYATTASDNEVNIDVTNTGALRFRINNVTASTGNVSALLDGKMHHIAASWDNTAGDVRFYVDGQLVSTTTGIKVGYAVTSTSGTLVLGQDQDLIDGGYDATQGLKGTLYDLRIWDRAISDEQVSQNYQQVVGAPETGLIANWRMAGISGGTTVIDSVGGVNLTLANVAAGGAFTSSTTTASLSVTENATVGTRVGQVIAMDVDLSRDIVLDGLFREAASPGTSVTYTSGQTLGNWTVASGSVDLMGTSWQSSPLGGRSIDLNGSAPGAITQSLATVAGRQYQVIFNYSGNWSGGDATKDMRVSAAGTSQDFALSQPTGWSTSNMLWSGRSMTFTADASSTALRFESLDLAGGICGPAIADVRVIEIPQAVQTILNSDATLTYDAATGKFYKTVNASVNYSAAQTAALGTSLNGISGQLLNIGSRYENDLAWSLGRSINKDLWLAASDSITEGTWKWYSGTTAGNTFWVGTGAGTLQAGAYANWAAGEPNDFNTAEDNAQLLTATGLWNDIGSSSTLAYVIEWDASEVLSNLRYTITSDSSGAFTINANTGEITIASASPLNEIATDPSITVQVTGAAGNTYSESFTITVNQVNDNTPVISSNGAGTTASISIAENTTAVTTVVAADADLPTPTLTYSVIGGADQALFIINSSSGALSFVSGRDFENATDAGTNNTYDVVVRASDGTYFDDQSIAVSITTVNEAPTDIYTVPNITEANVLGYYSFSSLNNLGRDDAGDTSAMTFTGVVSQTTGPSGGGALDLSGGAYGSIASMTTGGAMTIATWVKFDTTSSAGWERVVDFGQTNSGGIGNIYIGRESTTNNLTFTIEKNPGYTYRATLTNGIVNGAWMHVAGTVDASGTMTLYVNGVSVATTAGVAPDVGVRTSMLVGKSNWTDGVFDGAIDDLLITNGAMGATSIARLYQQASGFSIAENSANGSTVGTLLTTDPDASNTYTYSLVNSASGRFAVNSATGVVTVADSSLLNFESTATHTIVARTTDQGGLTRDETITISLTDVNEAPVDLTLGSAPTGLTTVGNASLVSGSTYQLTPNSTNQSGAVWSAINLSQDFAITSKAYLGASDSGADGFTFSLQNQSSTAIGGIASGMGVYGINSAFGIEIDTFTNGHSNEISGDFSQFFKNGNTFNQGTAFDTANAHDNLEDGLWHDLVINWNAATKSLSYSIDGVAIDSKIYDVVATDWSGNANGWFGFTAATGGATSQHQVEIISVQTGGMTSVAENSANGTVVGTVAAIDPDRTGTIAYSLVNNPSGAFAINSSTGQITVANGSLLDYENNTSRVLSVRTTDQAGLTYDESVTINVTNVNDAPTFTAGSGRNYTAIGGMQFGNAVAQQEDGKYVMAGWSDGAGTRDFVVIRYNLDGSLDTSFGSGTGYVVTDFAGGADEAQDIRVLSSGKILVTGYAINGGSYDVALVQYNTDGSLDTTFGSGTGKSLSGYGGEDTGYSMSIQSDGKILVAGGTSSDFQLTRFNSNGSLDTAFGTSGRVTTDFSGGTDLARSMVVQSDGKIVLAGQAFLVSTATDFAVARYNADGSLDTTFNSTGKQTIDMGASATDQGYGVALQSDGKLLISGWTSAATADFAVVRLTTAGALDTSFNTTGKVITTIGSGSEFASDVAVQADGKILVSGYASVSGNDFALVRYNTNGSLDTSFGGTGKVVTNFNSSTDDRGTQMLVQANGKIVMAGGTTQSGTYDLALARFNSDGTADVSFNGSNTLGGTISYTENATGVVMDSDVQIFDPELTPLSNFSGATLTLVRSGGTNSQDLFSATGVLSTLTQGGNVVVSGTTIGTVTTNSSGTLVLTFNSSATQSLVNSAMRAIAYANSSDAPPSSVQVNWTFSDGNTGSQGSGGALATTGSVTVNITAVNDAPVLTPFSPVYGTTENSAAFTATIATVLSSSVSDSDAGAIQGVAVIGSTGTAGLLEYSTNGGTSWTSIGAVSASNALLLRSTDMIRFSPDGQNGGTMNLNYRAWDQTSGTFGTKIDASVVGGTTAFSTNTEVVAINVSSINDAPTLASGYTFNFTGTNEDTNAGGILASVILANSSYADVDTGSLSGMAITSKTGNGSWQYSTDGTTWNAFGTVASTNALLVTSTTQVRYIPDAANGETATFTYKAWDQTTGTASTNGTAIYASTASSGGTTAFSTNTDTAQIVVTSLNDAPILDALKSPVISAISEHAGAPIGAVGTLISSLVDFATPSGQVDNVTDADGGAQLGIAVTAIDENYGAWWYSTDNGTVWNRLSNATDVTARLLAADGNTRIYFQPNAATEFSGSLSNAITFRAWDQSSGSNGGTADASTNGGTTAFSTATDTASLSISAVNDAPVLLGSELATNGTFASNISSWTTTGAVDYFGSSLRFGLGSVAGPHTASQTISTTAGQIYALSFDYRDGNGLNQSLVVTVNGTSNLLTTSQIVSDKAGQSFIRYNYTFTADSTTSTVRFTDTSDQSGLGNNGASVDSFLDNISVRQQNGNFGALAYSENQAATAIYPTLSLNDVDSTNLTGAIVQFTAGFNASQDTIAFTNQLGITGSYNSATGVLTLSGTTTLTNYQTALQTVTYLNSSDAPSASRTISFTVDDGSATNTLATRDIAITAVNDAPTAVTDTTIAVEAGGTANGTAGIDPSGNVLTNDTDVDAGDTKTVSGVAAGTVGSASGSVASAVVGSYGSINIAANGSYTYTVDNSNATVQALRTSGNTITDVFTYTATDTAGLTSTTQITVTIQGANDAPIAVADTATAVEAGGAANGTAGTNPTGNVLTNDTDVDSGDTKTVSGVAPGTVGSASGSVASAVVGSYGSINIAANGSYTYTVDNTNATVQALRSSGNTITDVFTYTATDTAGLTSSTQITVTIQGANDAPIAVADTATAVEAGGAANGTAGTNPTGNVLTNDTDVDSGDTKTVSGVAPGTVGSASGSVASAVVGSYGSINIAANGSYTYTVDNTNATVQALRTSGNTITDVFTYTATDTAGLTSSTQITVTIQGANDAPIAVADTATAVEAGGAANGTAGTNPTGNVLTNDTDVDSGDTKTVSGVAAGTVGSASGSVASAVVGSYGSINIAANGSYTYTVDNTNATVQALRSSGNTITDVFTYTATDTAGLTSSTQITVTIQGANDAPIAVSDAATAVEAGGAANGTAGTNPTGNVLTNDTDVDSGDTKTVSGVAAGTVGSASGSVASAVVGSYGSINIAANGSYTYTVDNTNATVQALRTSGNTIADVFTYTATDTAGLTSSTQITVTIQGANDAPIAVADTATAVEAGGAANGTAGTNPTGNVLTNDTDVDSGDTKTVSGVAPGTVGSASGSVASAVVGSYGSINIAANGSYTYTVDNTNATVQALRSSGNTITDVFTYTATDTAGLTSSTQITVTIQGANDAPIAVADTATAVEAGGAANGTAGTNPTGNVLTNDTDVDSGDTKTVSGVAPGTVGSASGSVASAVVGSYGSINIAANGSYTYTVDNTNATVQALRTSGNTITDVFTYTATDTAGLTSTTQITVTIQGANDAPYDIISGPISVSEDTATGTTIATVTALDVDAADYLTFSLTDDASGRFSITSAGEIKVLNVDRETAGSHMIVVRATDAGGAYHDKTFTINVLDVNEFSVTTPVDLNVATNAIDENVATGTEVGITASAGDADATTNTVTYSLTDSASGLFQIDANTGVVTTAAVIDRELQGATRTITVRATSSDGSTADQNYSITINDIDEFNVGSISDSNVTANSVAENAAVGTVVGLTAAASDADSTTNTISYSLSNNDGGRFAINSTTGVVTVAGALDREADGATRTITVRATSADGSTSDQIFAIAIVDADEFNVTAPIDSNAIVNTINEASANGTVVGITALAADADATTNAIAYSLDDSAGGRFAIDTTTGVVTVADSSLLNYEDTTSHTITIRATSADGSIATQNFTINLTDVNETWITAVSDADASPDFVLENAAIGTVVGFTGLATDADATDSVSYALDDDAGGRFAIDSTTGIVTVSGAIDREAAASYNITVRATSTDSSSTTQSFTINIGDVNEFNVGAVSDASATSNSVTENSAIGTVVGITAAASDSDATTNTITYSLVNDDGGRFAIDANTGVVTVAGAIDREADGATRSITVRATSADGSTTDQLFTISVVDANEFSVSTPTDANVTGNTIAENSANGTVVGITALAADADATNNTISYSLDDSAGGRFTIDATTGVVTVADSSLLNYEASTSHTITIRATSADGSIATQNFTINLTDVNETSVTAVSDANATANFVLENSSIGAVVGLTGLATDADGTDSVSYTLDDTAGGRFAIDSTTGVVTVAGAIDREAAASYNITVRATSTDSSSSTQSFTINIGDVDEFNVGAVSDVNATTNSVVENSTVGTVVGITAAASDSDATTNTITYSLVNNDGGRFAIDANTGVVTVAGAIDREADGATRSITVRATSADGSTTDQLFTISVVDANEFSVSTPTDVNAAANTIAENSANGTVVGITALAADADATNNAIAYSLDDSAGGRFTIDATTGVVTVADSSLLNYEASTSHAITIRATSADGSIATQNFTINLTDVNETSVTAVSDANATANFVLENSSIGAVVGLTGLATDADGTDSVSYTLDDTAGGRFAIDSTTGVVTVAGAIDREAAASYNITVRATSTDSSSSTQSFTINIGDVDEFNVGAVSDVNATTNSVVENSTVGTVVGITAAASDSDATTNTITYSLVNDDGGRFAIDANTGVVTVAGAIDREADGATRSITVRATSADGSTTDQLFTISVVDANEFSVSTPTDANVTVNTIAENSANGTVVGITAMAADADATNNTIAYSLDDSAGGRFTIDATTGVVTVADSSLLNYEASTSHTITIRATSTDGSIAIQNFTINLTDVNETSVTAVSDANATANFVLENSSIGAVVGLTGLATDADGTDSVSYTLDDTAGGRFAIDSTTGVVTVAGAIDREAAASYNITVRATSTDSSSSTQSFTINIGDVDEFNVGAVSDVNATTNSVVENSTVGTVVGITAAASDSDATTNTITYSLVNNDGGRFAIDANTGVVTVAGAIDREADGATRSITVRATSADGSTTDQLFTISVVDANEFSVSTPTDANVTGNTIAENSANGTVVGITALAADADATNNAIAYSLDDSAGGRFTIDATTGVVTVADSSLLNYEASTSHTLVIRATSADGSIAIQNFTVNLTDVNETSVTAVSDANATADFVLENSSIGAVVGITGLATDADRTDSVNYSLDDDAGGRFAIDSGTGIVTVAGAIDREAAASYNITVRATSTDSSSSTQTFTINIGDADEFDVTLPMDSNAVTNLVAENSITGTLVGITALAIDGDTTNNTITYSLDDSANGRFAIDSISGVITVANGSLLNYEAQSGHLITIRGTSSDGSTATQSMSIQVANVNEAPTATSRSFTTNNVQALSISSTTMQVGMTDPENDGLFVQLATGPAHGTIVMSANGSFVYQAVAGFVGTDEFRVQAFDGQLLSEAVTISITVTLPPVNMNSSGSGSASSGSASSGATTTADSSSGSSTTESTSSQSSNTTTTTNATESTTALPWAEVNSKMAEREMVASQSESSTNGPLVGVAAMINESTNAGSVEVAAAQLGSIDWNPITVSANQSRGTQQEEAMRSAARRTGDILLLTQEEMVGLPQESEQNLYSFAEPAKWTVISTGIVIWAVRLGHIITTFASTASVWIYFDPLTLISSSHDKTKKDDPDHASEAMFDK